MVEISKELQKFIEQHITLIEDVASDSYEALYMLLQETNCTTEFTEMCLSELAIDPAHVLGYVPKEYLRWSSIQTYEIPRNVKSIEDRAFYYCQGLRHITIPSSVKNICSDAFDGCKQLESLVIEDGVEAIYSSAFEICYNLTDVTLPKTLKYIGHNSFSFCQKLEEVKYSGTIAEAKASVLVGKDAYPWRSSSPINKIICTDGVLNI